MAFADFRPHYVKVKDQSGNELGQVRALNEEDLGLLWQKHEDAIETIFEAVTAAKSVSQDVLGAAAITAIRTAPALVTDIICLASGEDDWDATYKGVSLMPVGLRLELLGQVVNLTLKAEGGLEKLSGLFAMMRPKAAP